MLRRKFPDTSRMNKTQVGRDILRLAVRLFSHIRTNNTLPVVPPVLFWIYGALSTLLLRHRQYLHGSWDRTSDRDTAGGPLRLVDENKGIKNNPKWCQNPQYLLNIPAGCVTLAVGNFEGIRIVRVWSTERKLQ